MAIVTATVSINAAFLQEIKTDHLLLGELFADVRKCLATPTWIANHARVVSDLLEELLDQLALHFALEEAIGYFEDTVSAAPRLSTEAEELRNQHGELFEELRELVDSAQAHAAAGSMSLRQSRQLARAFHTFDERFLAHEKRENELIMIAFEQDIGVGD